MSKFTKRIQKTVKKIVSNCIVVGIDQENIEYVTETFKTVFYIDSTTVLPRARNLIPIQEISFLYDIAEIDAIFLNQRYDGNVLQFITPLSRHSSPVIFLKDEFPLSTEYIEMFKRIRYEMITNLDTYQVWKAIRK